jgi:glycine/D-amino acid oxidase-like deaminating enzyme
LSAEEAEELTAGVLAAESTFGAAFHPSGGQVTAPRAAQAIAREYVDAGGKLETRLPATRLQARNGQITAVQTGRGQISAQTVVLAAGSWANVLLREHDRWLAQVPLVASRVVTEPLGVPASMPAIMLREALFYAREEQGALLWGTNFDAPPRFSFIETDPPERFEQLPLDGFFEMQSTAAWASDLIPLLKRAKSRTLAVGAPTFTADHRPLVGPLPTIGGLLVASGCNEAGVTHGPGFGKLISELIVDGHTSLCSIEAFRPDRFGPEIQSGRDIVEALARTRARALGAQVVGLTGSGAR